MDADKQTEPSVVEQAIAELNSSYGSHSPGPSKTIMDVFFVPGPQDFTRNKLTGTLTVRASHEGLHNEEWEGEKSFTVTPEDLSGIARNAPRFHQRLREIAEDFNRQAAAWQKAKIREMEWTARSGLPALFPAPKTARFKKS